MKKEDLHGEHGGHWVKVGNEAAQVITAITGITSDEVIAVMEL